MYPSQVRFLNQSDPTRTRADRRRRLRTEILPQNLAETFGAGFVAYNPALPRDAGRWSWVDDRSGAHVPMTEAEIRARLIQHILYMAGTAAESLELPEPPLRRGLVSDAMEALRGIALRSREPNPTPAEPEAGAR